MNTNGALSCVAAIYREIVEELELAYVEAVTGDRHIDRAIAVIDAKKFEAELKTDTYGMINDAQYVIKRARQEAVKRICDKQSKPHERVDRMLTEVMN